MTGKDRASLVLLVLAFAGAVVMLFYRPFGLALPVLLATMVGVSISDKYRRLGLYATAAITICFVIGASFAIWDSRPLY
jgi:uncharacterized membrane-anchored protein